MAEFNYTQFIYIVRNFTVGNLSQNTAKYADNTAKFYYILRLQTL